MTTFPIGYRSFHSNPQFNYELNRWLSAWPEDEVGRVAARIHDLDDWKREMLAAAARAEAEGRARNAAYYFRAAEFFMHPGDPDKLAAYDRFVELFEKSADPGSYRRHRVPFAGAWLPAMEIAGRGAARDTVVLHGGFDSFVEEFLEWGLALAEAGYRVVLFEGPGQGAALRRHGLVMRPEWERPVGAVLDHFGIEACTILGISLGGFLAPRAAAFEARIKRVIAFDVLDDFFDCFASRGGALTGVLLRLLSRAGARGAINRLMARAVADQPNVAWALAHGMQVSGAADPYEFVRWLLELNTASFSSRITQDFLLLAGSEDHIVPLHQFHRQARRLPNVRSFTGRVFSRREQAHNHCQVGNLGLAMGFVRSWLDFQLDAEARGLLPA